MRPTRVDEIADELGQRVRGTYERARRRPRVSACAAWSGTDGAAEAREGSEPEWAETPYGGAVARPHFGQRDRARPPEGVRPRAGPPLSSLSLSEPRHHCC